MKFVFAQINICQNYESIKHKMTLTKQYVTPKYRICLISPDQCYSRTTVQKYKLFCGERIQEIDAMQRENAIISTILSTLPPFVKDWYPLFVLAIRAIACFIKDSCHSTKYRGSVHFVTSRFGA